MGVCIVESHEGNGVELCHDYFSFEDGNLGDRAGFEMFEGGSDSVVGDKPSLAGDASSRTTLSSHPEIIFADEGHEHLL